jgi:membrane-bound ClpP family serine protease
VGDVGRTLIVVGGIIALLGVVLLIAGRSGLPIGRLPGDIVYRSKNTTIYFPIVTSIVLSVILSLAFYLWNRYWR